PLKWDRAQAFPDSAKVTVLSGEMSSAIRYMSWSRKRRKLARLDTNLAALDELDLVAVWLDDIAEVSGFGRRSASAIKQRSSAGRHNRLHDPVVARATAEVSRQRNPDFTFCRTRVLREEGRGRDQ